MAIYKSFTLFVSAASLLASVSAQNYSTVPKLNPSCNPGGNFDLSKWTLQLPFGSKSNPNEPESISPDQLENCGGYHDTTHNPPFFFTESGDGAMVMKAPGDPEKTGCVKYAQSEHCRTEFAETNPANWKVSAPLNRMFAQLAVVKGSNICIGQAFQAGGTLKPVVEIYYNEVGNISAGIEQTAAGHDEKLTFITNVPYGQVFTYELRYENNELGIIVDDGELQSLNVPFDPETAFFKMGNYNQGEDDADIHVYQLTTQHEE